MRKCSSSYRSNKKNFCGTRRSFVLLLVNEKSLRVRPLQVGRYSVLITRMKSRTRMINIYSDEENLSESNENRNFILTITFIPLFDHTNDFS